MIGGDWWKDDELKSVKCGMSRHYFGLNRATVNFEQGSAKSELHQGQKKKEKKKSI